MGPRAARRIGGDRSVRLLPDQLLAIVAGRRQLREPSLIFGREFCAYLLLLITGRGHFKSERRNLALSIILAYSNVCIQKSCFLKLTPP